MLALAGGMAGSLLALAGIRGLALVLPRQNVPFEVQLRVDGPALAFCLGTAVVTTLVFGLLPAWYAGRRDLVEGVKDGGRGSGGGARNGWLRNGLVVGEIALSMVLLLGAGLLIARVPGDAERRPGVRAVQSRDGGRQPPIRRHGR